MRRDGLRLVRARIAQLLSAGDQEPCGEPEDRGPDRHARDDPKRPERPPVLDLLAWTLLLHAHGSSPEFIVMGSRSCVPRQRYSGVPWGCGSGTGLDSRDDLASLISR